MEAASRRSGPRSKMQTMLDNSDKPNTIVSPERATRQESTLGKDQINKSANVNDDGFSRFYSAFGSIINRISAPLAFAGLPLINEEQPEAPTPAATPTPESPVQKRTRSVRVSPSVTAAEPDLKKIYSRAALRAVSRDGQLANDSFYVVPPSGHTASYASILSFADKEKRRLEAQGGGILDHAQDPEDDDFVDARESQVVARSPALQKLGGGGGGKSAYRGDRDRERDLTNAIEELYLENKSLKDMLDKVSKRLHAFESMSQNSGMRLAESMRLMRPASPLASPGGKSLLSSPSGVGTGAGGGVGASDEALARRNRELEDQLLVQSKQMEEMERDYKKARANLVRYREKWEQLKAGAKARRAGTSGSSGMQGAGSEIGTDGGLGSPSLG